MKDRLLPIQVDKYYPYKNSWMIRIEDITAFLPYSVCKQDPMNENIFFVPEWLIVKKTLDAYIMEE